jgi:ribosomal protein S16
MVTIRLSRTGVKKRPFYHVVVADSRRSRDGRFIERIGYFNPVATGGEKRLALDSERATYWLGKGARPSDRVAALIKEAGREVPAAPEAAENAQTVEAAQAPAAGETESPE